MQVGVMSVMWALDHLVYVSDYHRAQWEDLEPVLKHDGFGWVTKNGFDPSHLPTESITKDPHRIIHVSRPERGLKPLLSFWPQFRALHPEATLQICRYSSMYDQGPGSWSDTCAQFDQAVERCNADVGGITYLGELNKRQLYRAISEAAVMWYPGVATFAETSCIAAIEAQACGTPFVGSLKGALVETARPSYDAGLLIPGDAEKDGEYAEASMQAVSTLLGECQRQAFRYRALQRAGRQHVLNYRYGVLAWEWEQQIESWFRERYKSNKLGVLRQLLHEDDHVAAREVAADIVIDRGFEAVDLNLVVSSSEGNDPAAHEAAKARLFCDYVIAGKDQNAEQYGNAAIADPLREIAFSGRFKAVWPMFAGCTRVLDVACGNGSFAIGLALADPNVHIRGLDYSQANIERATEAAERAGVADRVAFQRGTVYDFDRQAMHEEWLTFVSVAPHYDGLFVGEFIEHVGSCTLLVDSLEAVLGEGAKVIYTCPHGACAEMMSHHVPLRRGHVHRFHTDDLKAVFGQKQDFDVDYFVGGITGRGTPIGNWIVQYTHAPDRPAGLRPLKTRIRKTRPLQKLTVGVIAKDAENDLARCLTSIWHVADEIIVGDTGSRDTTVAIAESFRAKVLQLPPVDLCTEGFSAARNDVLRAATGDWFFWIDTDEQLLDGYALRKYLDGPLFNGFVLEQTHLYIDAAPNFDKPVRVFRRDRDIRFYGCIHEQPQQGHENGEIYPSLHPHDLKLAHTGYLTERQRQEKREFRNLPLLLQDQRVFPTRHIGHVLCVREAVLQADALRAAVGGRMTTQAAQGYGYAVKLFVEHFDDPTHRYHKIARPWYEAALRHLGVGWEFELGLAGRQGGLEQRRPAPQRIWVRDAAELQRLLAFQLAEFTKGMEKVTFKTDPFTTPDGGPVEEADALIAHGGAA